MVTLLNTISFIAENFTSYWKYGILVLIYYLEQRQETTSLREQRLHTLFV